MSIARHHSEWLSLVEVSGPFLSMPVLMRVFPQGLIAHDPEKFRTLKLAHEEWQANNEGGRHTNPALHGTWIKFVLTNLLGLPAESILEHQAIPQSLAVTPPGEHAETVRPSLVLNDPATGKPRLLIHTYQPDQNLDKHLGGKTWEASPGTRMMELLHATGVRLGLVTNGERWMLVDAPRNETSGFASWYATLWTEEPITFRAFLSLLSADRFFNSPEKDTLEAMLAESATNQQEVTDQLGYQVRRAVEVLVQSLDRADQDHGRHLLEGVDEKLLYEAALTVMMRLVFLFCAEERRLLPTDSPLFTQHYAASTMREQLRKTADDHGEEILERRYDAWCRLLATCRLVYGGCEHANLRMPAYGGHLFDPDRFPFLEGRKPGTKWTNCEADPLPINNRTVLHLLEALQLLKVKIPGGEKAARRLSFRALDIEQIGHVYEGMLDHTAKRATEPMLGLGGGRDREPEIALSKLEELKAKDDDTLIEFLEEQTGRSGKALKKSLGEEIDLPSAARFQAVCGNDAKLFARITPFLGLVRDDTFAYPVVIPTGSVFVTAGTDRRSSGTHYTPKSLTEPIVQYTLEPLVYIGPAEGKPKDQWKLHTAAEILALKICDLSCGSGAFLVQGCRYMADRLLEAWDDAEKALPKGTPGITPEGAASTGKPGETLIPKDLSERLAYAQRIVAQRCLYGVDINPLAVEMAKLSLWLLTLAKDKPFTFLDHSIRCGDSLVGIHNLNQLRTFSLDGSGQQYVFGEEPLDKLVDKAVELRLNIESMSSNTLEDVEAQAQLMCECEQKVQFLKCAADLLIAAELKGGSPRETLDYRNHAAVQIGYYLTGNKSSEFRQAATSELQGHRPFHWPVEFPEIMARQGGFDAFVGNPPFIGGRRIRSTLGGDYLNYLTCSLFSGSSGNADLCAFFFRRVHQLLREHGSFGLLATNTISQGDTRSSGLERLEQSGCTIIRAVQSRPWPGAANLEIAHVWGRRGPWGGACFLDDTPSDGITSFLAQRGSVSGTPFRLKANDAKSFQGTIVLGMGFVLEPDDAQRLIDRNPRNKDVLFPFLNGEDLNSRPDQSPSRWVINFFDWSIDKAMKYTECFRIVEEKVKPERLGKAKDVEAAPWWQFWRSRSDLYRNIKGFERVLVGVLHTKFWSIATYSSEMVFSHAVTVFAVQNLTYLSLLESFVHEAWAREYSGSLETRLRYTPSDCFETFPFPPKLASLEKPGRAYDNFRRHVMIARQEGLTSTYNRFHDPDEPLADIQKLRELHIEMDNAVVAAYGWDHLALGHGFHHTKQGTRFTISEPARREVLARLLKLNHERYAEEVAQGLHDKNKRSGKRKSRANSDAVPGADQTGGLFSG
jgi:hypothetical protein